LQYYFAGIWAQGLRKGKMFLATLFFTACTMYYARHTYNTITKFVIEFNGECSNNDANNKGKEVDMEIKQIIEKPNHKAKNLSDSPVNH